MGDRLGCGALAADIACRHLASIVCRLALGLLLLAAALGCRRQDRTCVLCRALWNRVPQSLISLLGFERLTITFMSLLTTFLLLLLPLLLPLFAAGGACLDARR